MLRRIFNAFKRLPQGPICQLKLMKKLAKENPQRYELRKVVHKWKDGNSVEYINLWNKETDKKEGPVVARNTHLRIWCFLKDEKNFLEDI